MRSTNKSFTLLLLFTSLCISHTIAQPCFDHSKIFQLVDLSDRGRAKLVMQPNEFDVSEKSEGNFFCNPLVLNKQTLNYEIFSLQSKGELALTKGHAEFNKVIEIPFYVYLRRDGKIVRLPEEGISHTRHFEIEISKILKYAKEGDQLIIQPANKEDWQAKRILKLLKGGC